MRFFAPREPNNEHQGVHTGKFDGVGDWPLETREFRESIDGGGRTDKAGSFCFGNPEVGKTYPR